jgi:galactose mutarotase-like enzyme
MNQWRKTEVEGWDAWTGETEQLVVTIVPELGGKAVSLQNRKTGREWLWRSDKPLGNEGYGTSFAAGDESGWDEMFPAIDAGAYPQAPWQGRAIPDHGEVWSRAWEHQTTSSALTCRIGGVLFPYVLEKTYTFPAADTLRTEYTVANLSGAPFSFLWAAHPLLQVREGMKLHVPNDLKEIEVSYSAVGRLGAFGSKQPWPLAHSSISGGLVDLSTVEPNAGRFAEKYYFTGRLGLGSGSGSGSGYAGISDPATGEALMFYFPADQVPYLAVWANYGGFSGNYHVALEPATGCMDELAHAVRRGEAAVVPGRGVYRWHLDVSVK